MVKKQIIWMFVFLICVSGTLAFTPYDCTNYNVYDNFNDGVLNTTIWNLVGAAGTEAGGGYERIGDGGLDGLEFNVSTEQDVSWEAPLGDAGCVQLNFTSILIASAGRGFRIYMGAQELYNQEPGIANFYNVTFKLWREGNTVYYNCSELPTCGNITEVNVTYDQLAVKYVLYGNSIRFNITEAYYNTGGVLSAEIRDETNGDLITSPTTSIRVDCPNYNEEVTGIATGKIKMPIENGEVCSVFVDADGDDYKTRMFYVPINGKIIQDFYLLNTSLTDVHQVTFTVKGIDGLPIEDAFFNITRVIDGKSTTIFSGITDLMGQITIYLNNEENYGFVVGKEGYITETFYKTPTETSYPITIREDANYINYDQPGIYIPQFFYNRTLDIYGVAIHENITITYNTDYRIAKGLGNLTATNEGLVTETLYRYPIILTSGTDFNETGYDNITLLVYTNGTLYNYDECTVYESYFGICPGQVFNQSWNFTIIYVEEYMDLFNEDDIRNTPNIIIALIIIIITSAIGFAIKDSKVGIYTFMILATISGIIKPTFIALSIIGGIWLALNIINMVIKE